MQMVSVLANENMRGQDQVATAAACEACRRLKMKCVRNGNTRERDSFMPCERCERNNRACRIPDSRPLGRRRGARGRYQGVEKAVRKLQSEMRNARLGHEADRILEIARDSVDTQPNRNALDVTDTSTSFGESVSRDAGVQEVPSSNALSDSSQEPISNPLALLADASDAARELECPRTARVLNDSAQGLDDGIAGGIGHCLLHRPGYVSLGLRLNRQLLEHGLDALFEPTQMEGVYSNYFNRHKNDCPHDVGPDLDPVDLGLVTMDEVNYLFPIYFSQLHLINGILDPVLHTPEFVRSRSSLLFTWVLALTAQFEPGCASIAKRLRLHGETLSNYVHTNGFKSVEIVQGYYISLLSPTPAKTLAEDRSWLYTVYSFGVALELELDQDPRPKAFRSSIHNSPTWNSRAPAKDSMYSQILARNRERTWLRILLWGRANNAAYGRMHSFPETTLTKEIDTWWLHPLADSTDRYTCAFIILRKTLANLHCEIRDQSQHLRSNSEWIKSLVDVSLQRWCSTWLSHPQTNPPSLRLSEQIQETFLRYVYLHGRLWTLSIALHDTINTGLDTVAIRRDCFESAVNICEVAVHDLQSIGESLYGMLAPTWAMISYAAVLTLKLFPTIYGSRSESQVELFALLGQVALQLERAGRTPSHRFGVAALLGQHLMMILKARSGTLRRQTEPTTSSSQKSRYMENSLRQETDQERTCDPFVSEYDSLLAGLHDDPAEGEFADLFRGIFGPVFGGVF